VGKKKIAYKYRKFVPLQKNKQTKQHQKNNSRTSTSLPKMTLKSSYWSSDTPVKELSSFGYEVIGALGEGAFGTVMKAMHLNSQRLVAIKVIPKNKLEVTKLFSLELWSP